MANHDLQLPNNLLIKDGGQILFPGTQSSWVSGRDNALISMNGFKDYDPLLSMKTKDGSWELGAYVENAVWLSYITDTDHNANTNKQTAKFRFRPDGVMEGTATNAQSAGNATVAAKLARGGDVSIPMTFNWSGQGGQPSWLWGGNDGSNMYVYNPSNFRVSYAASAGNADTVDGKHASDFYLKTDALPTGALELVGYQAADAYGGAQTLTFAGVTWSDSHDYIVVSSARQSKSSSYGNYDTWWVTYLSRNCDTTTWHKFALGGKDGNETGQRITINAGSNPLTVKINSGSYGAVSVFRLKIKA